MNFMKGLFVITVCAKEVQHLHSLLNSLMMEVPIIQKPAHWFAIVISVLKKWIPGSWPRKCGTQLRIVLEYGSRTRRIGRLYKSKSIGLISLAQHLTEALQAYTFALHVSVQHWQLLLLSTLKESRYQNESLGWPINYSISIQEIYF